MKVLLAALVCCALVDAHFLWLREEGEGSGVVTFSEDAGQAGSATLLPLVAEKIGLSLANRSGMAGLRLSARNVSGGKGQLEAAFESAPPFRLNLACTFGMFGKALLKYTANADRVATPNDWFDVQDWGSQEGLDVTIRDPWMKRLGGALAASAGDSGDECKAGGGPTQDGEACVVAVIRFNGQLLDAKVSLTTFFANGTKLRNTTSSSGVTILKVPLDASLPFTEFFASVNYQENSPGTHGGASYSLIDHWATTYARLARANGSLLFA